jgi:hypothetical protein
MSEAPTTLHPRERSETAQLAAVAVGVVDRLARYEAPRRIEILQIAIALVAAEIQHAARARIPRDE